MPQLQALAAVPSLGQRLGEAVGLGVQEGLSQALQGYQERKKAQSQISALENLLGEKMPPGFTNLPEKIQSALVQDKLFSKLFADQQSNMQSQDHQPEMGQIGVQQQPQTRQGTGGLSNLSDNQLIQAMGNPIYKEAAKAELDRRNIQLKATVGAETKRSSKYLESLDTERENISKQKNALITAENAYQNRDMGFFSIDNLARLPGLEGLSSKDAATANAASKTFFLSDLETAVGRPNMFLEKILSNAIFGPGKSNEANLALVDFYKNKVEIAEEKIRIADELEDYYRNKGIPIPGNISRIVNQKLKPVAEQKQKELIDKYKNSSLATSENTKDKFIRMYDPSGNLREVPKEDVKKAKAAKYTLAK